MGNLKHSNHKKESIKTKNLISMPPPQKKKKLKITKDRE